jgi:8-oxo-dGTP diphosphatase
VLAVGGVVLVAGPRVLVVRRGHPPLEGAWTLPGGRLREGESITDAVAREVFEETAVAVDVGPLVEVVALATEGYDYVIHDHLCFPRDPERVPRAGDDATDVRYATPAELVALQVAALAVRVIHKAIALHASRGVTT